MRILPGDPNKQSLKDRGLTWEMVLEAIETDGLLNIRPDSAQRGQIVLVVDIMGYIHAVPCEFRDPDLRMITAFPSRKLQNFYHR